MSLPNFKLLRPRTVQEATGYLARYAGAIQILAGGTDLLPSMRQRLFAPEYLMDISGIEELKRIRIAAGAGAEIVAVTTLSAIEDSGSMARDDLVLQLAAGTVDS